MLYADQRYIEHRSLYQDVKLILPALLLPLLSCVC